LPGGRHDEGVLAAAVGVLDADAPEAEAPFGLRADHQVLRLALFDEPDLPVGEVGPRTAAVPRNQGGDFGACSGIEPELDERGLLAALRIGDEGCPAQRLTPLLDDGGDGLEVDPPGAVAFQGHLLPGGPRLRVGVLPHLIENLARRGLSEHGIGGPVLPGDQLRVALPASGKDLIGEEIPSPIGHKRSNPGHGNGQHQRSNGGKKPFRRPAKPPPPGESPFRPRSGPKRGRPPGYDRFPLPVHASGPSRAGRTPAKARGSACGSGLRSGSGLRRLRA
jgi:hypothetical protein